MGSGRNNLRSHHLVSVTVKNFRGGLKDYPSVLTLDD